MPNRLAHLPSDAEWKQLEMYLGMSQKDASDPGRRGFNEGGKLKEAGTSHWESPIPGATNKTGFLPCRVVTVVSMVILTALATKVTGGVLQYDDTYAWINPWITRTAKYTSTSAIRSWGFLSAV